MLREQHWPMGISSFSDGKSWHKRSTWLQDVLVGRIVRNPLEVYPQKKLQFPGDSSRDLFFPRSLEVTNNLWNGHLPIHWISMLKISSFFVAVSLLKDWFFVGSGCHDEICVLPIFQTNLRNVDGFFESRVYYMYIPKFIVIYPEQHILICH